MDNPKTIRKDVLARRNNLSPADILEKSASIRERLLNEQIIQQSKSIFAYVSFRSEVETVNLINELLKLGKTVSVPITHVKEHRLDAIQITDPKEQLVPGYCDIPEPKESVLQSNLVQPETIDTIILPGSVFDKRCGRFGYGGGFYDRFVSAIPAATRIALAFDLQIIEKAPLQDHDELLDMVITESQIIQCKR